MGSNEWGFKKFVERGGLALDAIEAGLFAVVQITFIVDIAKETDAGHEPLTMHGDSVAGDRPLDEHVREARVRIQSLGK